MKASEPDETPDFPDVTMGAKPALFVIAGLAAVYAVVFVLVGTGAPANGFKLLAGLFLATGLLFLSYFDLRRGMLYDALTLPMILAGLAAANFEVTGLQVSLLQSILGAIIGYSLIAGLAYFWRRFRGYNGIGLGDAKLLAAGGAWTGATTLPVILLISSLVGILAALFTLRGKGGRAALAFGPCLALAIWIAWCLISSGVRVPFLNG